MFPLILWNTIPLLAAGLLTVVLWLARRQSVKSEQLSEEARGSDSRADKSQCSANESPDVLLRVEGEVLNNNRHGHHLQYYLKEDKVRIGASSGGKCGLGAGQPDK